MPSRKNAKPLGAETDFVPGDSYNLVMLGHPMLDSLLQMSIALGAELWTVVQRQRITETLLAKHGKVTPDMIEQYMPTEAELAQWGAERKAMVDRIYSVMAVVNTAANPAGSVHPNLGVR